MRATRLLGVALGTGLLAGVALDVLTYVLARYGPQGESWSFRGNGALVVPFGLGPAVVAGAWTALVLRSRGSARWRLLGIVAGLVGAAFVIASVAALILFGSAGQRASNRLSLFPLAWMVIAPVLAGALRVLGKPAPRLPLAHVAAGVVFPVALAAGFYAAALVVSPGS
jgi:hypothetical protein